MSKDAVDDGGCGERGDGDTGDVSGYVGEFECSAEVCFFLEELVGDREGRDSHGYGEDVGG